MKTPQSFQWPCKRRFNFLRVSPPPIFESKILMAKVEVDAEKINYKPSGEKNQFYHLHPINLHPIQINLEEIKKNVLLLKIHTSVL